MLYNTMNKSIDTLLAVSYSVVVIIVMFTIGSVLIWKISGIDKHRPAQIAISCVTHTNELFAKSPITLYSKYPPHISQTNNMWKVELKD